MNEYELLDSGNGRKLERFGPVILDRPCAQAVWAPQHAGIWNRADAVFSRKEGLQWQGRANLPDSWIVPIHGIRMKLSTTDFGHLGVFPETRDLWDQIRSGLRNAGSTSSFLNLFAYSGGATLAAASCGTNCCHVDASRGMVDWARENAELNQLAQAPIRWIVDDVTKFLAREIRRDRRYDAVLLDPPSFGRGRKGELYKIEQDLLRTLEQVRDVLSPRPRFVFLSSHTPGFTPLVLENLLMQTLGHGRMKSGEMILHGSPSTLPVPSGTWARWEP